MSRPDRDRTMDDIELPSKNSAGSSLFMNVTFRSTLLCQYAVSRCSECLRTGRQRGRSLSPGRGKNCLHFISSRPVLVPTYSPSHWVPGLKRPGREADHSPPVSAEIKNPCTYTATPLHTS
jgi:hypothetical protein